MKGNSTVRMTAVLSAFAIAVSAVSCGKKNDDKKEAKTADKVIANSYSAVKLESDLDLNYVRNMEYVPDAERLFISGYYYDESKEEGGYVLCSTDIDLTDCIRAEIPNEDPENGYSNMVTTLAADGNIWAFYCITDYGDYKLPEEGDFDEDEYAERMKNAKYSYILKKYNFEGEELTSSELNDIEEYVGDSDYGVYIDSINETSSGDIMIRVSGMGESNILVSPDGTCKGSIELDEMYIYYTAVAADGRIAVAGYEDDGTNIRYIDPETMEPDGDPIAIGEMNGRAELMKGSGDYNLLFSSSTGLCGVTKDGDVKEIINWVDSDLCGDFVNAVADIGDGEFLIYYQAYTDAGTDQNGFYRLSARNMDDLKNTKVITVAMMYPDSDITSRISEFNKQNNGYRITVEDYSKYSEYDSKTETVINSPAKQFQLDVISGKVPDMLVTYDRSTISLLAGKGLFADLYDIMDKSDGLSKDDILPNVLKANEIDGKLYSISPFFSVNTWAAKADIVDHQGWTLNEMIETYDKYKDKMSFTTWDYKDSILYSLIYQCSDFIDYEKGTCNFDSPDFIKLMEFCNQFPSYEENADDDGEIIMMGDDNDTKLRNGKVLIDDFYLSNPSDYAREKQGRFGTDITLVGYPDNEGSGGVLSFYNYFSIIDSSPNKEQCWDFINMFFAEDYNNQSMWNFPSRVSAFEQCMEQSMSRPYYIDSETNKKVEYDDTYYAGDKEIKIKPLTKEEADFISDYIKNTTAVSGDYSDDVANILQEEIKAYFAGEKTAEEAASMIQNRASLLISEQS